MVPRVASLLLLIPLLALPRLSGAEEAFAPPGEPAGRWSPGEKVVALNAAALAVLLAHGFSQWDYGSESPHIGREGWFGERTKHGGADKVGHAYTGYLIGRLSAKLYSNWGYDDDTAPAMGFLTSAFFTTAMELADSFSDFGFSPEDVVGNLVGAAAGYGLARDRALAALLDFRVEYQPSLRKPSDDPTTDYEHIRYHLVLKLSGFGHLRDSWFRYGELHLGYYTRDFHSSQHAPDPERHLFVGAGINLATLFEGCRAASFFNYYQAPYTYFSADREL